MPRHGFALGVTLFLAVSVGPAALPAGAIVPPPTRVPITGPVAAPPLDLAAMALTPADLPWPDAALGYSLTSSPDHIADFAEGLGQDPDAFRADLDATGVRRRYDNVLAVPPVSGGADQALERLEVGTYLIEFGDPTGAAAGFALLEDESRVQGVEDLVEPPALGDRSELSQWTGIGGPGPGRPYQALDLSFQFGSLYGGVVIYDYSGEELAAATIEPLARTLLARIEAELDRPGINLGNRILRLDGANLGQYRDSYVRQGNEGYPLYGDPTSTQFHAGILPATNAYVVDYDLAGDGNFTARVLRFASVEAASSVAAGWPNLRWGALPGFVSDIQLIDDAPTLGDESVAFRYADTADPANPATLHGRGTLVRVGRDVALVMTATTAGISPTAAGALAAAQVACLVGPACPPASLAIIRPLA